MGGRYPKPFCQMAVDRLKSCENIGALAEELGVHRRLLYKWRDRLEPLDNKEPPECARESTLRQENARLKPFSSERWATKRWR